MAHIINIIVQEGMKEVGDLVKRVREVVRYISNLLQGVKDLKIVVTLER